MFRSTRTRNDVIDCSLGRKPFMRSADAAGVRDGPAGGAAWARSDIRSAESALTSVTAYTGVQRARMFLGIKFSGLLH